MPTYFHNPENSFKRANEFCELGKKDEALECLYDALKNRKSKILKQIHESIVNKFLELCVELRKSQLAKDGLYCYRNLCLGVNVKSWEDSVRRYLQLAENEVQKAQEAFQSLILDVEDLDQDITPEILLKVVSTEGAQDRTERIILLPWVKFLWECYRNCLDLLRNSQTDKLYHIVAQNAFKFCVTFVRKNELRKLCNILKMHAKHKQKRYTYLKSDDVEIQFMHLETAFVELECAVNMELWQDAFKSAEDIHSIISASKKFQHSRVMAHYYDKISSVFWKGEEYLFHAATVLRYFLLVRDQKKNLSSNDITKLVSRVLLSTLAVPFAAINPAIDLVAETDVTVLDKKHHLLSSLLDMSKSPTRDSLVNEVIRLGIIHLAPKEFQDLFKAIEYEIEPTKIRRYISAVSDYIHNWIDCDLEQYIPLMHKTAVVKLLSVLPKMYSCIKLSTLIKFTGISEMSDLEIILVDSARKYEFPLRIDHRNMCVHFSSDFNIFQNVKVWDKPETKNSFSDPHLKCLMYTYSALKKAVEQIYPESMRVKNKFIAEEIANSYIREREVYHKKILHRKNIIEKHKEYMENLRLQKEEEEKKLVAHKLLQYETAEKERLLKETEKRNLQRLRREQDEIKRKMLFEKIETFKKTPLGSQIAEKFEFKDLNNLDPQILFSKQIEQLNRERRELSLKLRRQEKCLDHFERAKRGEEIPLLIQQYDEQKNKDLEIWKEDDRNNLQNAHKERVRNIHKKNRMLEMKNDLMIFLESINKRQSDSYTQQMKEFTKILEEEKVKRLKVRAVKRNKQRKDEQQNHRKMRSTETRNTKQVGCVVDYVKPENKHDALKASILDESAVFATSVQKSESKMVEPILNEKLKIYKTENSLYPYTGKRNSVEITGRTHHTKNIYYYKKVDNSSNEDTEETDAYEQKTAIVLSGELYAKAKGGCYNLRSNYCNISDEKTRTTISEKSNETDFSWRTPSSNVSYKGFTFTSQCRRLNRNDEIPQRTITIMKRKDPKSEISTLDQCSSRDTSYHVNFEKPNKPEERRRDADYSCTPWAKLKRQEPDK